MVAAAANKGNAWPWSKEKQVQVQLLVFVLWAATTSSCATTSFFLQACFFLPSDHLAYSMACSTTKMLMSEPFSLSTPHDQTLSQSESLAWVQIFLNASLACISYTRELIPWQAPCFKTRYIDQIAAATNRQPVDLYASFCELDCQNPGSSQELRVLAKGGHRYADQILDMLVRATSSTLWLPELLISAGKWGFRGFTARIPPNSPDICHQKHGRLSDCPRILFLHF